METDELTTVRRAIDEGLRALAVGDLVVVGELLADDCAGTLGNGTEVAGKGAVLEGLARLSPGRSFQAQVVELVVDGEIGYLRLRLRQDRVGAVGRERSWAGSALAVLRRRPDGGFLLARFHGSLVPVAPAEPAVAAGPGFRLAFLGPPRVWPVRDGARPEPDPQELRWPLKRCLRTLAFLAVAPGREVSRDELLEALWGDADEATIERNFHPTLSHLRRTLRAGLRRTLGREGPPPVLHRAGAYRLNPQLAWVVDGDELTGLLEAGRRRREAGRDAPAAALWEEALALYRGPFLEGYWEAWAELHRERYRRAFLDLLRELAMLYRRQDRLTEAIDAYRRVLFEDPLEESVHVALMQIYALQGRRDLVRRQYERLTGALTDELGVEALVQTTEEYHRLMG
jgi:DNA-binding SARP family transcriptional activator/ketosteroid isomerase-like protein